MILNRLAKPFSVLDVFGYLYLLWKLIFDQREKIYKAAKRFAK
jgi:hypothetical protein